MICFLQCIFFLTEAGFGPFPPLRGCCGYQGGRLGAEMRSAEPSEVQEQRCECPQMLTDSFLAARCPLGYRQAEGAGWGQGAGAQRQHHTALLLGHQLKLSAGPSRPPLSGAGPPPHLPGNCSGWCTGSGVRARVPSRAGAQSRPEYQGPGGCQGCSSPCSSGSPGGSRAGGQGGEAGSGCSRPGLGHSAHGLLLFPPRPGSS